jgi:hypothetical protein
MIAEYRRILKNPTPERKKKCIFFDALHNIYQAKDSNGVRAALNNYEEEYNLDPIDFGNGVNNDNDDSNNADGFVMNMTGDINGSMMDDIGSDDREEEVFSYAMSPSQALNGVNGSQHEDDDAEDSFDDTTEYGNGTTMNGTTNGTSSGTTATNPTKRVRSDSNYSLSDHQYQSNSSDYHNHHNVNGTKRLHSFHNNKPMSQSQQPLKRTHSRNLHSHEPTFTSTDSQQDSYQSSFESSSCALLIDRMFAHLGKETEVMREWVQLERERLSQEVVRRREEKEREERREKVFLNTLSTMQEQMFSYLSKVSSSQPSSSMDQEHGGQSEEHTDNCDQIASVTYTD